MSRRNLNDLLNHPGFDRPDFESLVMADVDCRGRFRDAVFGSTNFPRGGRAGTLHDGIGQ